MNILLHARLKWIRRSLKCIYFWFSHKIALTWLFSRKHLRSLLSVNPNPLNVGFGWFHRNNKYVKSKGSLFLPASFRGLLQPAVKPGRVFLLQTLSCLLKVILLNLERSSDACHKKGLALCQLYLLIMAEQGWANIRQEGSLSEYLIQATWPFPLLLSNQLPQN